MGVVYRFLNVIRVGYVANRQILDRDITNDRPDSASTVILPDVYSFKEVSLYASLLVRPEALTIALPPSVVGRTRYRISGRIP